MPANMEKAVWSNVFFLLLVQALVLIAKARDIMFDDVRRNYFVPFYAVDTISSVEKPLTCMKYCVLNQRCFSVNFNEENNICKLLAVSVKKGETCIAVNESWTYYGSKQLSQYWQYSVCALEEQTLSKNNLLSTLPVLKKSWYLSFDLKIKNLEEEYTNIFHAQSKGFILYSVGSRVPSIYVLPGRLGLHICLALNGTDFCHNTPDLPASTYTNVKLVHYEVESVFKLFIFIGDELLVEYINTTPTEYNNVDVFASTVQEREPADASIKNLVYHNIV